MFFALSSIFALLVFVPSFARAEKDAECSYRNNYEVPNSPLKDIPVYHQGETNLCYAYTAAQLTEYHLRKTRQWSGDAHIDPLWIGIAYKGGKSKGIRFFDNDLSYGYLHTALKDIEQMGICDPKVFEQAFTEFKGSVGMTDPDFLFIFEDFWDRRSWKKQESFEAAYRRLLNDKEFRRIAGRSTQRIVGQVRLAEALLHTSAMSAGGVVPSSTAVLPLDSCPVNSGFRIEDDLRLIYQLVHEVPAEYVKRREKITYLRDRIFAACQGKAVLRPQMPVAKALGLGYATNKKLKRSLDEMLDRPDVQPAGIGYCSNIVNDDPSLSEAENEEKFKRASRRKAALPRVSRILNNKNCSMHYSMIVGRRPGASGCQYLIRNTWGKDFWTKRYECLCKKKGSDSEFENCSPTEDEKHTDRVVGCWIDEKPLLNSMFDLVVTEKGTGIPATKSPPSS